MRHGNLKTRTISTAIGVGMVLLACSVTGLSACTAEAGPVVQPPAYVEAYPYGYYSYDDPIYGPYDYGFWGSGWDHHHFDHDGFDHGHFAHAHAGHFAGGHFGGHAGGGHR